MTKQHLTSGMSTSPSTGGRLHANTLLTSNLALEERDEYLPGSLLEHYRNHTLTFLDNRDICIGEVFLQEERIAYCESIDLDSARQYCRQIVDERLSKESFSNEMDHPCISDFVRAIRQINEQIDQNCLNLLNIHLKENNQPMPIEELKKQAGFDSTTGVFLQYADWARLLCDALTYLPPTLPSGKDPYLGLVIEYHEPEFESDEGLSISLMKDIYLALIQVSAL